MFRLTPGDLLQLKGGGGEPFAHFVDRLIRAEAARGGLARSEILTQLRANVPDGGVDTQVKQAMPQDSGWFNVPTCWQFKAVEARDIDDKDKQKGKKKKTNALQDEIRKPFATELIRKGYGYRLCLLGDLTPEKVQEWEAQLKQEALAINPKAPDPRVIHGADLIAWAERFPALVAKFKNWTHGGLHWDAWQDNCRSLTPAYVPNPAWNAVRLEILQHVQFSNPSVRAEVCLPIGGAAGVGKTRLVFETLNELAQAPGLVLYLADEKEARAVATTLAVTPGQSAILVVDECSLTTRHFLNENLRGHAHRLRMICMDNAGEKTASAAGQVWLKADSLQNTEAILEANFPDVPEERRRQYARFSKGFVRFAAFMCREDEGLAAGNMSQLLTSVEEYVRNLLRRMGDDYLPILSMLALFHKVGFRDEVAEELNSLCPLSGYGRQQFLNVVQAAKEAPGFVVQAGRYWYITPEIVARVLFAEGYRRWVENEPAKFFQALQPDLFQQLLERAGTHGSPEVRTQIGNFFRGWFSRLTAADLAQPAPAAFAAAVIETSPEAYLPQLRSVLESATLEELHAIRGDGVGASWGPRRTLVWLLERLVAFPEFFEDCEASLFRLALAEAEPQIANNASSIWANLFRVYLSGTATPYRLRLPALRQRTGSKVLAEARLGFLGLATTLSEVLGGSVGEPMVAGRLRPGDWRPATVGEERDCYRAALKLCERQLSAESDELRQLATVCLFKTLYFLVQHGIAPELQKLIAPERLGPDDSRRVLQLLEDFLQYEEATNHSRNNEAAANYLRGVREWSDRFRPTDFGGRLRNVCAREPWDERFARDLRQRDEADELAAEIVADPRLLSPQLDWLASPEANSAERLGFALGRVDVDGDCGRMIFSHAIACKAAPLLRGYIRGLVYSESPPSREFLDLMTRLEETHPGLAVEILSVAGDGFDAWTRIIRLVDRQVVSPKLLVNLAGGLARRNLTASEVTRLLPYFLQPAKNGDADTAVAGLRFLEIYLLLEAQQTTPSCLSAAETRTLAWELVEAVLPSISGRSVRDWSEIVRALAVYDVARAAALLGQALLAEGARCEREAEKLLKELAATAPSAVMDGFGAALLDRDRGWRLQVSVCRELVASLPAEAVLTWVRRHGLPAARTLARHLPLPHLDDEGRPIVPEVLDRILLEYDDDDVFRGFIAGAHSGEAWWGNGADRFRRDAQLAQVFLHHSNHRIREWAREQIESRLQLAEMEDRHHEERFLPS